MTDTRFHTLPRASKLSKAVSGSRLFPAFQQHRDHATKFIDERRLADSIEAQSEVLNDGVVGVNFKKFDRVEHLRNSEVLRMLQVPNEDGPGLRPVSPRDSETFKIATFSPSKHSPRIARRAEAFISHSPQLSPQQSRKGRRVRWPPLSPVPGENTGEQAAQQLEAERQRLNTSSPLPPVVHEPPHPNYPAGIAHRPGYPLTAATTLPRPRTPIPEKTQARPTTPRATRPKSAIFMRDTGPDEPWLSPPYGERQYAPAIGQQDYRPAGTAAFQSPTAMKGFQPISKPMSYTSKPNLFLPAPTPYRPPDFTRIAPQKLSPVPSRPLTVTTEFRRPQEGHGNTADGPEFLLKMVHSDSTRVGPVSPVKYQAKPVGTAWPQAHQQHSPPLRPDIRPRTPVIHSGPQWQPPKKQSFQPPKPPTRSPGLQHLSPKTQWIKEGPASWRKVGGWQPQLSPLANLQFRGQGWASSAPKPFKGATPKANIVGPKSPAAPGISKYNSPAGLYSERNIAKAIEAQTEVLGGQTLGVNFLKFQKGTEHLHDSPVYRMIHGLEDDQPPPPARLSSFLRQ